MNAIRQVTAVAVLLGVAIFAAAQQPAAAPPPSQFKLMSSAYAEGTQIPPQYTCATPNGVSPALQWSNPPKDTASFAIVFHDTDGAPGKTAMDVTHWILWNVPATSTQLAGSIAVGASPDGIAQGKNIAGANGYRPPCPPVGATPHHYIFEMYALDKKLDLAAGSTRVDLLAAVDGHVLGKATYVGMVGR